jgi:hypothetical protein
MTETFFDRSQAILGSCGFSLRILIATKEHKNDSYLQSY